jgi:hypothetical protein
MGLIANYQADSYSVRCRHCRVPMALDRVVPQYGALPELRRYKCQSCGTTDEFEVPAHGAGVGAD